MEEIDPYMSEIDKEIRCHNYIRACHGSFMICNECILNLVKGCGPALRDRVIKLLEEQA